MPRAPGFQVVIIELFAGIMPATAALHKLGVHSITYFSETANDPLELLAIHWPNAVPIGDIEFLTEEHLTAIAQRHPGALFWITGGVPREDASSVNQWSAEGHQTRAYKLAAEIKTFLSSLVENLVFTFECTRMDDFDKNIFSEAFGVEPVEIDNNGFSPLHRPRWWWIGGKRFKWKDAQFKHSVNPSVMMVRPIVKPTPWKTCLLPGYWPCSLGNIDKDNAVSPSLL